MKILPKKFLVLIPIALLIAGVLFFVNQKPEQADMTEIPFADAEVQEPSSSAESPKEKKQQNKIIMLDIKGGVKKPGVYKIDADARVNDAIMLAGGFTKDADEAQINLAQKVQDEMVINVPYLSENSDSSTVQTTEQSSSGSTGNTSNQKVNINQATQEELESLSGIGPSKASAIIQYRDEHGMFQTVEELMEIPGIGEKTLDNIRDAIQVP